MKFWKKSQKKPHKDQPQSAPRRYKWAAGIQKSQAEQQHDYARKKIEEFIEIEAIDNHLYEYSDPASLNAINLMPQYPHLGRKALYALGYQQVLKHIDTHDILIRRFKPYDHHLYLTPDDHKRVLTIHQNTIKAMIARLEAGTQKEAQQLLDKQKTVQTIKTRLDTIQAQQDLQEADLDQKLTLIQQQLDQVEQVLSQKQTKNKQEPSSNRDLDRLEQMLATLQRLKNDRI